MSRRQIDRFLKYFQMKLHQITCRRNKNKSYSQMSRSWPFQSVMLFYNKQDLDTEQGEEDKTTTAAIPSHLTVLKISNNSEVRRLFHAE